MSKWMQVEGAVFFLVTCMVLGGAWAKEKDNSTPKQEVVATLTKEQVSEFTQFVRAKELRRQEFAVCERLIAEKKQEQRNLQEQLKKEFGLSTDQSYTYEKDTQTLFLLSTNKVDKAGKPERTAVKKLKTGGESEYLTRLMIARNLTEQQLVVLAQLCQEKKTEYQQTDAKLRQTFKLEPSVSYRLDDKTSQIIRIPEATVAAQTASGGQKDAGGKVGANK